MEIHQVEMKPSGNVFPKTGSPEYLIEPTVIARLTPILLAGSRVIEVK